MGPGQYNTMQMGGGANPFASAMAGGYQNPNHNRPNYQTGFNDNNPFGAGPSAESWQRDVHELGFDVKLNVQNKPRNDDV